MQVARRIDNENVRADAPLAALKSADEARTRASLLRVLGGIGGSKALAVVQAATADKDAAVQDAAVRALAGWPDASGVGALLQTVASTKDEVHRVLALRGCVRLLELGGLGDGETLKAYGRLLKFADRADEKRLLLGGLGKVADPAAAELVEPLLADAAVLREAEQAIIDILKALVVKSPPKAKALAARIKARFRSPRLARTAEMIVTRSLGAGQAPRGPAAPPAKPPAPKPKPAAGNAKPVPAGETGWKPLFNGKDLTGWTETGDAIFKVEGGMLIGTQTTGKGGDLWTKGEYDNFELRVTYRVDWPANSGVWFRHNGKKGYQYDILKYKKPVAFSGTLYCPGKLFLFANLNEALENRDGWNEAHIRAAGQELTHWLNGTMTGTARDDTLAKGKIGIQVHPGDGFKGMKITFKRFEIRPIAASK